MRLVVYGMGLKYSGMRDRITLVVETCAFSDPKMRNAFSWLDGNEANLTSILRERTAQFCLTTITDVLEAYNSSSGTKYASRDQTQ